MKIAIRSAVHAIGLTILTGLFFGEAFAQRVYDNKNVSLSVSKGQKIQIQTMYAVNTRTCTGDKTPPKPIFFGKLKFGSVNYRLGTTNPRQCPKIVIDANFADYIASEVPGTDKFKIHWKSAKGTIYIRNYKIKVE